MGVFNRRPQRAEVVMYLIDETADDYYFDIVGESRCRDHLRSCIRQASVEARALCEIEGLAELVPEPTNEFDPNAIQVWIDGGRVGYIGRSDNLMVLEAMQKAYARGATRVVALSRIGWNDEYSDPLIGVRLRLKDDPDQWRSLTRDELAAEAGVE